MDLDVLFEKVIEGHPLHWSGIHGLSHWGRVLENGLRLAPLTGADPAVVTLFAVFHDSRRRNDHHDPGHGLRGAELAAALRGASFRLADREFELLHHACALHTDGLIEGDITVQTCWDADRLDLGRVGITPRAELLCTPAARRPELIEWADARAVEEIVPESVLGLWERLGRQGR